MLSSEHELQNFKDVTSSSIPPKRTLLVITTKEYTVSNGDNLYIVFKKHNIYVVFKN